MTDRFLNFELHLICINFLGHRETSDYAHIDIIICTLKTKINMTTRTVRVTIYPYTQNEHSIVYVKYLFRTQL